MSCEQVPSVCLVPPESEVSKRVRLCVGSASGVGIVCRCVLVYSDPCVYFLFLEGVADESPLPSCDSVLPVTFFFRVRMCFERYVLSVLVYLNSVVYSFAELYLVPCARGFVGGIWSEDPALRILVFGVIC